MLGKATIRLPVPSITRKMYIITLFYGIFVRLQDVQWGPFTLKQAAVRLEARPLVVLNNVLVDVTLGLLCHPRTFRLSKINWLHLSTCLSLHARTIFRTNEIGPWLASLLLSNARPWSFFLQANRCLVLRLVSFKMHFQKTAWAWG